MASAFYLSVCLLPTPFIGPLEPTLFLNNAMKLKSKLPLLIFFVAACNNSTERQKEQESPTTGNLSIYCDEGLYSHVTNQAATFTGIYPKANFTIIVSGEDEAVAALYNDSCESIVICRDLNAKEKAAFLSKKYTTSHSIVAQTAVACIANYNSSIKCASDKEIREFLKGEKHLRDSLGNDLKLELVVDRINSGVLHYLLDSVVHSKTLAVGAKIAGSSIEAINYVASHPNAISFIDFAWISDQDSQIWKDLSNKIKLVPLAHAGDSVYEPPHQSSIKLGNYPFVRSIYVHRKSGEFSLSKGFESFVMGPKGQLTFLKQGLMPKKQQERSIQINNTDL